MKNSFRSNKTKALLFFSSGLLCAQTAFAANATVTVDASVSKGTLNAQLSTNLAWPGVIEGATNAQTRLNQYAPPLVRLHSGTDSDPWPLPEKVQNQWDFTYENMLVNNVRAYGGEPVLNVRYAPDWMWTCGGNGGVGTVSDQTFNTFADYMARLVSYYNKGSMVTETGTTITNPKGTANRMTYWEIWNEPDLSNETPCHPSNWDGALLPPAYVTMWNAVVPKMKAVDPTIKVVGPVIANAQTWYQPDYIPTLMANGNPKPDVISFHGYGGWQNSDTDQYIFDGLANPSRPQDGAEAGIQYMVDGLAVIKTQAPGKPIWITEVNVNSDWGNDPTNRASTAFGAAWGASMFLRLGLGGIGVIHQYDYVESPQFGLVDDTKGNPFISYWRDTLLSRSFPAGSTIVKSTGSLREVESMAVRRTDGKIMVLVVNRQLTSLTSVGGAGLSGTVTVQLSGITPASVKLTQIDSATPVSTGPTQVTMPVSATQQITFPGFGMAVLEITPNTGNATPPASPKNLKITN